ncbi:IucA/IucC family protein [Bacillus massilinigeriensis]|uniref:IucA/IucC family protein n=1 Tax=Bacillus mediterraneensis TaxID=1805474 RepID=UPI0008F804C9|nr:IucA/IucC family protein [Bacillus mediterraneensis]
MSTTMTMIKAKSALHLYEDEIKTLDFLKKEHPNMASRFLAAIEKGRKGIMRRLAASMLREDILGLSSESAELYISGNIHVLNVPAIDEYWQSVMKMLSGHPLEEGRIYKLYPLCEKECLAFPIGGTYAFNRVELEGDVLYISKSGVKRLDHPALLIELLRTKDSELSWDILLEELANGSANLSMAYAFWQERKKQIKEEAANLGVNSSVDWAVARQRRDSSFDSSLFFEQLSIEGHNLHPCAKTKLGMEPKDVLQYAPEFAGLTPIGFVGIHKEYAEWSTLDESEKNPNALLFDVFPALRSAAEQVCQRLGHDMEEYVFVPVHPWQLEKTIPVLYREELQQRKVVIVKEATVDCGATSSFRTAVPLQNGKAASFALKMAVNSQMTSTVRSISPNTANNAAVFSRMITKVIRKEEALKNTFIPVLECGGFHFKAEESEAAAELKNRNLSAVVRENVAHFISRDELAVVGSSLFAESPVTGKTIMAELVEGFAKTNKVDSAAEAAFLFFSEYMKITLPGFLTLMIKYGIGLEGHLQNSVMVFKNGQPQRMLFRDWGGARIFRARLEEQGFAATFYPGSLTLTENLKEMHNKLFYTVFQNHCGEFILQLCKGFGLDEKELWREVDRLCQEVFDRLEENPAFTKNARQDREALYQANTDHKALTRMRLDSEGKGYSYTVVPNPLHAFSMEDG